ncbi:FAD binding domain-containing protein, partial [Ampelomyces quisqualis]
MSTLDFLKWALRRDYPDMNTQMQKLPMSDADYSAGFATITEGECSATHQEHIVLQLSDLLNHSFNGRPTVSILEVGPGPRSVLGQLPYDFRRKIRQYTALEPNHIFAAHLQDWLQSTTENPLPCLESRADILCRSFDLGRKSSLHTHTDETAHKYDIVLFCHSMYGMKPKRSYIEQALSMLNSKGDEMVIVIHRNNSLELNGLVTHRTISLPSGTVKVRNNDASLDTFALFIAGCGAGVDDATRIKWRTTCRVLGGREKDHPGHLVFDTPDSLMAFNHHATALPRLLAKVPAAPDNSTIKNHQARYHRPAGIVRPTSPKHIQECVQWAIECKVSLTIVAGSHSGQCIWPNVVAVDMSAFNQVQVVACDDQNAIGDMNPCMLVVAEAGCTTESIVRKTLEDGRTVPLGARPSVGGGLPLQGGIGHLTRSHSLACDSIVGGVIVSPDDGKILCVGTVPKEHQPIGCHRPGNENDILWALKGAGTNMGIVLSVVFKTCAAPTFAVRNWVLPLSSNEVATNHLWEFDNAARSIEKNCSADAYLYWENGHLSLGVTTFEAPKNNLSSSPPISNRLEKAFGHAQTAEIMDGIQVFGAEMYMSGMHGGHGGGKTSSFKRCIFLKGIGNPAIAARLVSAVESRPSPMCYLHLLHGGGVVSGVEPDATAFGCRDWEFACVITGVWSRTLTGGVEERSAIKWVYEVANDLLPISSGAYGADLGPDPRDVDLAKRAFGSNGDRLARLKAAMDPHDVLVYTCPLPKQHNAPRLIVLVTGKCWAGKDYCGKIWQAEFTKSPDKGLTAKVVSISDATKREYAAHTGADLDRLLGDREYKERHRQALMTF